MSVSALIGVGSLVGILLVMGLAAVALKVIDNYFHQFRAEH